MAGIGFVLKRLASKDDLLGVARAYTHAAMAACGPWLFTVLALGGITLLYEDFFADRQLLNFRVVLIYNFSFSLVLSAPIYMVITRYLADSIHLKDVTRAPSVLLGNMLIMYAIIAPFAAFFYLYYFNLTLAMRLSAILGLYAIATVWLLAVYMTALKDYQAVTRAFLVGMIIAVLASEWWKEPYKDVGMLNGFTLGLAYIVFTLVAKIFSEYNYRFTEAFDARGHFNKYWELAWGGIFYNSAIWMDKWIMWYFAPESIGFESKMRQYPDYDSASFLAYLTIIPAIAMFVFSVETNFFQRYQKFYYDFLGHCAFHKIRENHKAVIRSIFDGARNFIVLQGSITFVVILLAPKIFEWLNINYMQIGIFKLATLGAFFQALAMFELVILAYFDNRRMIMWVYLFYMVSNAVFTIATTRMGFIYYGYGYFLSSLLTFVISSFYLFQHIRRLPYHAFITRNNSITYHKL